MSRWMDGRKKGERGGGKWMMLGFWGMQEWKIGERKKLNGCWINGWKGGYMGGRKNV